MYTTRLMIELSERELLTITLVTHEEIVPYDNKTVDDPLEAQERINDAKKRIGDFLLGTTPIGAELRVEKDMPDTSNLRLSL